MNYESMDPSNPDILKDCRNEIPDYSNFSLPCVCEKSSEVMFTRAGPFLCMACIA